LDRLQVAVIVRIGNVARNDLISTVTPLDSDPRNAVVVTLDSAQSGSILIVDTDYVFANIPSAENAVVLSGGTVMTTDVYDPTSVAADAFARGSHTGTQTASTISDFDTEVGNNVDVAANTAKVTNATHTGDVTGATALTITANAVTNAELAQVDTATIKGRTTAGTGDPEDLTPTQVRAIINVEDGADVTDATNVAAAGAVMETLADAKGDIFAASADNTVARLAVGADTFVLTADSGEATGIKWAAGGGGGSTIVVEENGSTVSGGPHDTLNFVGLTATDAGGGTADIAPEPAVYVDYYDAGTTDVGMPTTLGLDTSRQSNALFVLASDQVTVQAGGAGDYAVRYEVSFRESDSSNREVDTGASTLWSPTAH